MKKKLKVLIVAKPWKGGLYKYYLDAFKRADNVDVCLFYSYPHSLTDYLHYKVNKKKWYEDLIKKINQYKYDLGFFINTIPAFDNLESKNNVLYLTDRASVNEKQLRPFRNIYLSDTGYAKEISNNKGYLGELQFAYDPEIHRPVKFNQNKKTVQSIANIDIERNKWFQLMAEHNCFPDIYGNYFPKSNYFFSHPLNVHPPINFKNQGKIYSKYLISLNIHASVIKHGTNMKTFEACGFEVPQIINYSPGIEGYFEPETEIMIFSDIYEYKEKIAILKRDKNLRNSLIKNALKRARAKHKYDDRVSLIIKNFMQS